MCSHPPGESGKLANAVLNVVDVCIAGPPPKFLYHIMIVSIHFGVYCAAPSEAVGTYAAQFETRRHEVVRCCCIPQCVDDIIGFDACPLFSVLLERTNRGTIRQGLYRKYQTCHRSDRVECNVTVVDHGALDTVFWFSKLIVTASAVKSSSSYPYVVPPPLWKSLGSVAPVLPVPLP